MSLALILAAAALLSVDSPPEQRLLLTGGPARKIAHIVEIRDSAGQKLPFRAEPPQQIELLLLTRHTGEGVIQDLRTPGQKSRFEFKDVHSAVNELLKSKAATFKLVLISAENWQDFGIPFRAQVTDDESNVWYSMTEPRLPPEKVTILHRTKHPTICHLAMSRDPRPSTIYIPVFPRKSKDVEWNAIRKGVASVNGFVIEAPAERPEYRSLAEQIERNSVAVRIPVLGPDIIHGKRGQPTRTKPATVEITLVDDLGRKFRIQRAVY